MTLFEVAKELFSYLVAFRDRAASAAPPTMDEVRKDILDIFADMEAKVLRHPSLSAPYRQVRYPLAVFADEVILSSQWKHARGWENELLEMKFFNSNVAGDRFFEMAGKLDNAPRDVTAVFYFCLALGFRGHFSQDDPKLNQLKANLLSKLQRGKSEAADILIRQGYFTSPARVAPSWRLWRWRAPFLAFGVVLLAIFLLDRLAVWPWLTSPVTQVSTLAEKRLNADADLDLKTGLKHARTLAAPMRSAADVKTPPATKKTEAPPAAVGVRKTVKKKTVLKRVETRLKSWETDLKRDLGIGPKKQKQAPAAKQPAKPAAPAWKGFLVQVGTYNGPVWARRIAQRAQKAGYPAVVRQAPRGEDRNWYVVLAGPYAKLTQARRIRKELGRRFKTKPFIVKARVFAPSGEGKK